MVRDSNTTTRSDLIAAHDCVCVAAEETVGVGGPDGRQMKPTDRVVAPGGGLEPENVIQNRRSTAAHPAHTLSRRKFHGVTGGRTIVHEHMPELLQVLKYFFAASTIAPYLGTMMQRCFGGSDNCSIYHSIPAGNASREARHRWSSEIVGHLGDC